MALQRKGTRYMQLNRGLFHLIRKLNAVALYLAPRTGILQMIAGLLALILGFWGWTIKYPDDEVVNFFNNVFRTLQLVTLQFPLPPEEAIPWQLHVARLAVPAVAAVTIFNLLVGAITKPLRFAFLPNIRDHALIFGDEQLSETALRRLAARGNPVVMVGQAITDQRRDQLERLGLSVMQADPANDRVMRSLNLRTASAVFLAQARDIENLNLAARIIECMPARADAERPLTLAVSIENDFLASELDLTLDGLSRQRGLRYHRICADREGLELELARFAPALTKPSPAPPSHLLVVGLEGQWRQILSLTFTFLQDHALERTRVTLVLNEVEREAFEHWMASNCGWEMLIDWRVVPAEAALTQIAPLDGAPHLALVLKQDEEALATMLSLRRPGTPLRTEQSVVLVRQTREDRFLIRLSTASLADRNLADVVAFGGVIHAGTVERVLDREGEALAIALHAHYRLNQAGITATSPAALAAWSELSENLRDANRVAARHAPILFAAVGFRLRAKGKTPPPAFTPEELETLARVEHKRWVADRIDRGWRFSEKRDDAGRLHPSLVLYDALPEPEKQKDRDSVLAMAKILSAEGFGFERVAGPGA